MIALVRVLAVQVHDVGDLTLVDRAFLEGDVVVFAANPRGQSGSVVSVHLVTDVQYLKSKVGWRVACMSVCLCACLRACCMFAHSASKCLG